MVSSLDGADGWNCGSVGGEEGGTCNISAIGSQPFRTRALGRQTGKRPPRRLCSGPCSAAHSSHIMSEETSTATTFRLARRGAACWWESVIAVPGAGASGSMCSPWRRWALPTIATRMTFRRSPGASSAPREDGIAGSRIVCDEQVRASRVDSGNINCWYRPKGGAPLPPCEGTTRPLDGMSLTAYTQEVMAGRGVVSGVAASAGEPGGSAQSGRSRSQRGWDR